LKPLRARSREQVRNNDYSRRFIGLIKSNVIGNNGFVLQAKTALNNGDQDIGANDAIENAFKLWSRRVNCDYYGRQSFTDLSRLFIASVAEDGESIAIIQQTGDYFKLQFIDPDLVDVDYNETLKNGRKIIHGIEYDKSGKRTAYYVNKNQNSYGKEYDRVSADFVIHEFITERAGQKRGIPWQSAAMLRLNMLNKFEEAALVNARQGASKMGFYTSPDGDIGDDQDGSMVMEAEPGTFETLPPGVDFKAYDPAYPNGEFETFVKASLHGIASGLGVNYHSLASDLSGVNYSSARIGEMTDREVWKALQKWMIDVFIEPVYEKWLEYALKTGKIYINQSSPASFTDDKYQKFLNVTWQPRRWQWVDPQKEMTAHEKAINLGLKSRSEIIREMGRDPDEVWIEIQRENKKLEELGLNLNTEETAEVMQDEND
jgi:lambda family phage portal protein